MSPGMSVAPAPSTTRASARDSFPPRCTATMRWPSTRTSPAYGAAPLPSKIVVPEISVLSNVPSSFRRLQPHLAQSLDDEAYAIAARREFRGDAAARHHDHAALERPAASVEKVRQPRHGLERMAHGVASLALAAGLVVDPAARHRELEIDRAPVRARRAEHDAAVPRVLCDQGEGIQRLVVGVAVLDQLERRQPRGNPAGHGRARPRPTARRQ